MFPAEVLIGKLALGTSQMRVPPSDYDSTTNNKHISVTYRDDQAYAEYLTMYMHSPN